MYIRLTLKLFANCIFLQIPPVLGTMKTLVYLLDVRSEFRIAGNALRMFVF